MARWSAPSHDWSRHVGNGSIEVLAAMAPSWWQQVTVIRSCLSGLGLCGLARTSCASSAARDLKRHHSNGIRGWEELDRAG